MFIERSIQSFARSDESNCSSAVEDWTYDILKPCVVNETNYFNFPDRFGDEGFECGHNICVSVSSWCSGDKKKIYGYSKLEKNCPELIPTFDSERLCRNTSFWANYSCDFYHTRCAGEN